MLPEFMVLGFQKCGTTTLYEILKQHPGIAMPRDVKEPMYYRVPAWFQAVRGRRWYEKRYYGHIPAGDPRLCCEVNAGLTYSGCAEKLSRDLPQSTKLLFMLREPVGRSFSAYKYFMARGFLPLADMRYDKKHGHAQGFDHYVHRVLDDPKRRAQIDKKRLKYLVFSQSNYDVAIEEYLQRFPKENICFVLFEEFVRDQKGACLSLYPFLGIADSAAVDYTVRANEGNRCAHYQIRNKWGMISKCGFLYWMYELCHMEAWAPWLIHPLLRFNAWVQKKCKVPDSDDSTLLPQTREYLEAYYAPGCRRLEKLIGRSLAGIWPECRTEEVV